MTKEKSDSSTNINGSVSKSSIISGEVYGDVIVNYGQIQQKQQLTEKTIEYKRPPKPSVFRGESPIFVGRQEDINKIKQYLTESNAPVAIIGEEGLGKTALAFKTIHECE